MAFSSLFHVHAFALNKIHISGCGLEPEFERMASSAGKMMLFGEPLRRSCVATSSPKRSHLRRRR
jgi:hypothetical protein